MAKIDPTIIIVDSKPNVLSSDVWNSSDDYSLFHFTPVRTITDRHVFDDCSFIDLFIDHKTVWGAPIPSTFQHFFKEILELMMPEDYILLFNVVDLDEGYFEPAQFITEVLDPNNYAYFFLDKEIYGKIYPTLFFECPISKVSVLEDIAFPGTAIDVDGFILGRSKPDLFPAWHRMGNTDFMFRDLLRNVYMAFGIWADHNGLFIATDKFDIPTLKQMFADAGYVNSASSGA